MATKSRKVARKAFAALVATALTAITTKVSAYPPRIVKEYLEIFVRSGGTISKRQGIGQTKGHEIFKFDLFIYLSPASDDALWTAEIAEDTADDIEAIVRGVILSNPTNAAWFHLGPSRANPDSDPVYKSERYYLPADKTGGYPFDVEVIPVEIEVYDE